MISAYMKLASTMNTHLLKPNHTSILHRSSNSRYAPNPPNTQTVINLSINLGQTLVENLWRAAVLFLKRGGYYGGRDAKSGEGDAAILEGSNWTCREEG
ncbi:hypothetical protein PMG11_01337 [Penicillium brasilianum]|uniref:Uncharacterized protein n=1 Tax=Penicillium brasilianum TaxID=104259 RepID=A0A0F7TE85_PENBI|nr:hypothetical protein PMG11_01337 [Penicillium brasilianum]